MPTRISNYSVAGAWGKVAAIKGFKSRGGAVKKLAFKWGPGACLDYAVTLR